MKSIEEGWDVVRKRIEALQANPEAFTDEERSKLISLLDTEINALEKEAEGAFCSEVASTTEAQGQEKVRQAVREFRTLVKRAHADKLSPNLAMAVIAEENRKVRQQSDQVSVRDETVSAASFNAVTSKIRSVAEERKLNPQAEAKYIGEAVLRNRGPSAV